VSLQYELNKHMGLRPCDPRHGRPGKCTLIVNGKSEDILTSNVFGYLKLLEPSLWLPEMLRIAYAGRALRANECAKSSFEFWPKVQPRPHRKGSPEFDLLIKLARIKIVIECKYLAPVDEEQIIEYLELIVHHYHDSNCADVFFLLITMDGSEPKILSKYRDPAQIEGSIERFRYVSDPEELYQNLSNNIGWISWKSLLNVVERIPAANRHYSEKEIIEDLKKYLRFKININNALK